jgi:lysophospholipase L1-like esterase
MDFRRETTCSNLPLKAVFACIVLSGTLLGGPTDNRRSEAGGAATTDDDTPLRDAVECRPRAGLANFFAKLNARRPVKIAYLGGSITAANGWRLQTLDWFRKQYRRSKIDQIHAAIGGTGSGLGAYRLGHDVLRHGPDLVFVEFAVNDSKTPSADIHRAMEGIVRQIWKHDPSTDICYVYTLKLEMLADLQNGKFPRSASAMEDIADHYGIPSIHMGVEVARRERAGTLVFKAGSAARGARGKPLVFSKDGVHPLNAGHQIYTEVIARSMMNIQKHGTPGPHALAAPYIADNLENAKIVPLDAAKMSGTWEKLNLRKHPIARRFGNRMPALWKTDTPGSSLRFRFKGTAVGFYDVLGPDCGQLIVKIDGRQTGIRARIDHYCSYHRISQMSVGRGLKDEIHEVHVEVHPEQPDKAKIMRGHQDFKKNPKKYDGRNWYVGGIFLVGQIVE